MHINKKHLKYFFSFFIIFSLILSTVTVSAQQSGSSASSNKMYMWKVTPKDDSTGNNIIYLLGVVSVSAKDIYPLNAKIESAYSQCDKLVVDLKISDTLNRQAVASLLKFGLLEQTSIEKVISADSYKKADELIKKYTSNKKSLSDYKTFKPWVIESLILNMVTNSYTKYEQNGMSSYFIGKAQKDRKKILKLETLTLQYRLMGTQSYFIQTAKLENTLNNIESYPGTVDKLYTAWKDGDTAGMEELLLPDFGDNTVLSDSYNKMLSDRNKQTAGGIKKFFKTGGKYFVVVDASLMTGNNNLLDLLLGAKYNVEQM